MRRSSLRSNGTPSSSRHDSIEPAVSSGNRLTRSASSRNLSATPQPNDSDVVGSDAGDSVTSKKPRGRPRKSLLAESMTNSTSSSFVDDVPAPARRSGRPRKSTTATSVSLSSAPTPLNASSEDDLSTPPTSNLPTPLATDLYAPAVKSGSSSLMVVEIPTRNGRLDGANRERGLRSSQFSMVSNARNRKSEIGDSDEDEDEFSDNSPDAQVARRLQREENAKTLPPRTLGLPADHRTLRQSLTNQTSLAPSVEGLLQMRQLGRAGLPKELNLSYPILRISLMWMKSLLVV
uniref:Uncharacterized protein n=1 Tax=Bionectria ochroleuca TaxID=29856 RepID=A0A8H7NLE7_BIOOC